MPKYIVLSRLTPEGAKDIQGIAEGVKHLRDNAERYGSKLLGWYLTQGTYDMVSIIDAPDEHTMAAGVLALASHGRVQTETLRAFDEQEFEQIVQKMG